MEKARVLHAGNNWDLDLDIGDVAKRDRVRREGTMFLAIVKGMKYGMDVDV